MTANPGLAKFADSNPIKPHMKWADLVGLTPEQSAFQRTHPAVRRQILEQAKRGNYQAWKSLAEVHDAQSRVDFIRASRGIPSPYAHPSRQQPWHNPMDTTMALPRVSAEGRTTVYHLTDDPRFKLNADYSPEDNSVSINPRDGRRGLYVGAPETWTSPPYNYKRPYVAELSMPAGTKESGRWGGENFIPAEHFGDVRVERVMPYDHYIRREYGLPGETEEHHGQTYDTGEPLKNPGPYSNNRYREGTVDTAKEIDTRDPRQWSDAQHEKYLGQRRAVLHDVYGWGWNEFDDKGGWRTPDDSEYDDGGELIRTDREGKPMTRGRHASAVVESAFWRAHPNSRPFSPEDATSREWHGEGEPDAGYSSFDTPHELFGYFNPGERHPGHDSHVVEFSGQRVGTGMDGEPLVMPDMNTVKHHDWRDVEDMVGHDYVSDVNERNGWTELAEHVKKNAAEEQPDREFVWEEAPPGHSGHPFDRPDKPLEKEADHRVGDHPAVSDWHDLGQMKDANNRVYNVRWGTGQDGYHYGEAVDPDVDHSGHDDRNDHESIIKWSPFGGEIAWRGAVPTHSGGYLSMFLKDHLHKHLPGYVEHPRHSTNLTDHGRASLENYISHYGDHHGDGWSALGGRDDSGDDDYDGEEYDPDGITLGQRQKLDDHGFQEDGTGDWEKSFNHPVTGDEIEKHSITPDGRLYVYSRGLDGQMVHNREASTNWGDMDEAIEKSRKGFAERHLADFGWTPHYREPALTRGNTTVPAPAEDTLVGHDAVRTRHEHPYKWTKTTQPEDGSPAYHSEITLPDWGGARDNSAFKLHTTREGQEDNLHDEDGDVSGNLLHQEEKWTRGLHAGGRRDFRLTHPEFHRAVQEHYGRPASEAHGVSPNGNRQSSTPEDNAGRFGVVDSGYVTPEQVGHHDPSRGTTIPLGYNWDSGQYEGRTPWGMHRMPGKQMTLPVHVAANWWEDPSQARWQKGDCLTYAKGLQELDPSLRFGTAGYTELGNGDASGGWTPQHHFAHDDTHYYDSLGKHPLSSLGEPQADEHKGQRDAAYDHVELDGNADDWDEIYDDDLAAAKSHAQQYGVLRRTAALSTQDYDGVEGNNDHITRNESGTVPLSWVQNLRGFRGEMPGEHRNYEGDEWEGFKQAVHNGEPGYRNPLFIMVMHGKEPRIAEGNHRRDAYAENGATHVPVEVRYFGHAERQGGLGERAGMPHEAAVRQPGMRNPHTNGDEWFHGTRAYPEELSELGFQDPMYSSPEAFETPDADLQGHWNQLLGTHFTADHDIAKDFATGSYSSSSNDRGGDYANGRNDSQAVVHARLGLHNPKVYLSEHGMDREAYEDEWRAGNTYAKHLPELESDDEDDRLSLEETWPEATRIHQQYGNRKIPNSAMEGGHPARTLWLNQHPDRLGIASRFREKLQAAGHDGVVYGNEYERSNNGHEANKSAIVFDPSQIQVSQNHNARKPCMTEDEGEHQQDRLPGHGQMELPFEHRIAAVDNCPQCGTPVKYGMDSGDWWSHADGSLNCWDGSGSTAAEAMRKAAVRDFTGGHDQTKPHPNSIYAKEQGLGPGCRGGCTYGGTHCAVCHEPAAYNLHAAFKYDHQGDGRPAGAGWHHADGMRRDHEVVPADPQAVIDSIPGQIAKKDQVRRQVSDLLDSQFRSIDPNYKSRPRGDEGEMPLDPFLAKAAAIADESGLKAAGIAVIAMDTGRVLMQQRALNPLHCPCGEPVTWDESNGYQHEDGTVDHEHDEFYGQTVTDLLDQGHGCPCCQGTGDDELGSECAACDGTGTYFDGEKCEPTCRDSEGSGASSSLEFDPNEGTWEFPGGKLDPGESARNAAKREFREEVGQDLPPGVFVGGWLSPGGIVVSAGTRVGAPLPPWGEETPTSHGYPTNDGRGQTSAPELLEHGGQKYVRHLPPHYDSLHREKHGYPAGFTADEIKRMPQYRTPGHKATLFEHNAAKDAAESKYLISVLGRHVFDANVPEVLPPDTLHPDDIPHTTYSRYVEGLEPTGHPASSFDAAETDTNPYGRPQPGMKGAKNIAVLHHIANVADQIQNNNYDKRRLPDGSYELWNHDHGINNLEARGIEHREGRVPEAGDVSAVSNHYLPFDYDDDDNLVLRKEDIGNGVFSHRDGQRFLSRLDSPFVRGEFAKLGKEDVLAGVRKATEHLIGQAAGHVPDITKEEGEHLRAVAAADPTYQREFYAWADREVGYSPDEIEANPRLKRDLADDFGRHIGEDHAMDARYHLDAGGAGEQKVRTATPGRTVRVLRVEKPDGSGPFGYKSDEIGDRATRPFSDESVEDGQYSLVTDGPQRQRQPIADGIPQRYVRGRVFGFLPQHNVTDYFSEKALQGLHERGFGMSEYDVHPGENVLLGRTQAAWKPEHASLVSHKPLTEYIKPMQRSAGWNIPKPPVYRQHHEVHPEALNDELAMNTYNNLEHDPYHPEVQHAYDALERETMGQWHDLRNAGLQVEFHDGFGGNRDYPNSAAMVHDVTNNGHLWTRHSALDGLSPDHPMARVVGTTTVHTGDGPVEKPLTLNDAFRAVHDVNGHAAGHGHEIVGFGPKGEFNAWLRHRTTYSDDALPALWNETRGQAAQLGPLTQQGIPLSEVPFLEQKAGRPPQHMANRSYGIDGVCVTPGRGGDTEITRMAARKAPVYKGFIYLIQHERDIDLGNREHANPDDPDGDMTEQSAWWDLAHAKKNPALRKEVKSIPWSELELWADKSVRANKQVQASIERLAGQSPYFGTDPDPRPKLPDTLYYYDSQHEPYQKFKDDDGKETAFWRYRDPQLVPPLDEANSPHYSIGDNESHRRSVDWQPMAVLKDQSDYEDEAHFDRSVGRSKTDVRWGEPICEHCYLRYGNTVPEAGHGWAVSKYVDDLGEPRHDFKPMTPDVDAKGNFKEAAAGKCSYCKSTATKEIKHSEGMGLISVCDKHLEKGKADAEKCTPDGTRDPSNINWIHEASVQKEAIVWADAGSHPECGCTVQQMKLMNQDSPVQGWMTDHRSHGGRIRWKVTRDGVAQEMGKARKTHLAEGDMLDAYERVAGMQHEAAIRVNDLEPYRQQTKRAPKHDPELLTSRNSPTIWNIGGHQYLEKIVGRDAGRNEFLSSLVGRALGADVSPVMLNPRGDQMWSDRGSILSRIQPGYADRFHMDPDDKDEYDEEIVKSRRGQRLGLLDTLVNASDHGSINHGSKPDPSEPTGKAPHGIDYEESWQKWKDWITSSPYTAHFVDHDDIYQNLHAKNPLTQNDVERGRQALSALRPVFVRAGRDYDHDWLMDRWEKLGKRAGGNDGEDVLPAKLPDISLLSGRNMAPTSMMKHQPDGTVLHAYDTGRGRWVHRTFAHHDDSGTYPMALARTHETALSNGGDWKQLGYQVGYPRHQMGNPPESQPHVSAAKPWWVYA